MHSTSSIVQWSMDVFEPREIFAWGRDNYFFVWLSVKRISRAHEARRHPTSNTPHSSVLRNLLRALLRLRHHHLHIEASALSSTSNRQSFDHALCCRSSCHITFQSSDRHHFG